MRGCKVSNEGGVPADTAAQLNGAIGSVSAHLRDKSPIEIKKWVRSAKSAVH
jgi:hypothetical protein